jgi:hypothetical protein
VFWSGQNKLFGSTPSTSEIRIRIPTFGADPSSRLYSKAAARIPPLRATKMPCALPPLAELVLFAVTAPCALFAGKTLFIAFLYIFHEILMTAWKNGLQPFLLLFEGGPVFVHHEKIALIKEDAKRFIAFVLFV